VKGKARKNYRFLSITLYLVWTILGYNRKARILKKQGWETNFFEKKTGKLGQADMRRERGKNQSGGGSFMAQKKKKTEKTNL